MKSFSLWQHRLCLLVSTIPNTYWHKLSMPNKCPCYQYSIYCCKVTIFIANIRPLSWSGNWNLFWGGSWNYDQLITYELLITPTSNQYLLTNSHLINQCQILCLLRLIILWDMFTCLLANTSSTASLSSSSFSMRASSSLASLILSLSLLSTTKIRPAKWKRMRRKMWRSKQIS